MRMDILVEVGQIGEHGIQVAQRRIGGVASVGVHGSLHRRLFRPRVGRGPLVVETSERTPQQYVSPPRKLRRDAQPPTFCTRAPLPTMSISPPDVMFSGSKERLWIRFMDEVRQDQTLDVREAKLIRSSAMCRTI